MQGQPQVQPASGSNQFGITFMSAPYIPRLSKPSGKDTICLLYTSQMPGFPVDRMAGQWLRAGAYPILLWDSVEVPLVNLQGA